MKNEIIKYKDKRLSILDKNKLLFLGLVFVFLFSFGINIIFAADYTPFSTGLPSSIKDAKGFAPLVGAIYNYALGIVGLVAFGAMAWGGVLWVVSSASPSKLIEAKSWIWGAIWGILLLLGAYIILYTINSNLTNLVEPEIGPIPDSAPARAVVVAAAVLDLIGQLIRPKLENILIKMQELNSLQMEFQ
ncbi:hypothetical protein COV23_00355 [Candidatus Wolfebacteria bacterium CG10_big_fil_rev_8_21_14_0_10_31_9]|uniref:Uncharacterized protein n=1 Tax=Candidatus Wolfebacteria bacterium CG10_big_fil_rev_8_21_14_0_10_31_9 TaxID=1975070 RepID=A0A2H0RD13_9BACT|nr:MAG: hypothetical protein COV23_00355 [Candidatus Wolfebacteria bacterium CG10_big_fil_rev_8_21_14_0_10_31_9]